MTDKKYKLVPVEPTSKMRDAGVRGLSDSGVDDAYEDDALRCYAAMVAAAPEPVCRWRFLSCGLTIGCTGGATGRAEAEMRRHDTRCFACGKKVEVVGNE